MSFTTGPWIDRKRNDSTGIYVGPEYNERFNTAKALGSSAAEMRANAKLIAAAPDMVKAIAIVLSDDGCTRWVASILEPVFAKANGES